MAFATLADFLAMGGYGLYVWGSFAVTAAVLVGEQWSLGQRSHQARLAARQQALLADDGSRA